MVDPNKQAFIMPRTETNNGAELWIINAAANTETGHMTHHLVPIDKTQVLDILDKLLVPNPNMIRQRMCSANSIPPTWLETA